MPWLMPLTAEVSRMAGRGRNLVEAAKAVTAPAMTLAHVPAEVRVGERAVREKRSSRL